MKKFDRIYLLKAFILSKIAEDRVHRHVLMQWAC